MVPWPLASFRFRRWSERSRRPSGCDEVGLRAQSHGRPSTLRPASVRGLASCLLPRSAPELRSEWLHCRVDQGRRSGCAGLHGGNDRQVVVDTGGGRFRAPRSLTHEVLFWEGFKAIAPRPISLWLEPVITLAALARLHLRYSWPKESLGAQSKDWAFDLAAYGPRDGPPAILGEVKKSSRELQQLKEDLLRLSDGGAPENVRTNSAKKWQAVVASRPGLVWLVGPNEEAYVYQHEVTDRGCRLIEVEPVALACRG